MMSVEATNGAVTRFSRPDWYQRKLNTEPKIPLPSSSNKALLPYLGVRGRSVGNEVEPTYSSQCYVRGSMLKQKNLNKIQSFIILKMSKIYLEITYHTKN